MSREKNRFEKLMEYFINDDSNIDFMVGPQVCYLHTTTDCIDKITGLFSGGHPRDLTVIVSPGGLHAVHKHRGPFSGEHELPCSSAVRVHPPRPGQISRSECAQNSLSNARSLTHLIGRSSSFPLPSADSFFF